MAPSPLVAMFAALFLAACAPSLDGLLRDGHHGEAMLAAGESGDPEDEARVAAALARSLDPGLHVALVPEAELERALGAESPALAPLVVARVRLSANGVPVDRLFLDARLEGPDGPVELPVTVESMAVLTGERIPGTRPPSALASALHAAGSVGAGVVTALTFGLFDLMKGLGPGPRAKVPTPEEIEASAPRATKIARTLEAARVERGLSDPGSVAEVERIVLWPRTPELARASLFFEATVSAQAEGHKTVIVRQTVRASLPPGESLEARLVGLFGSRERRFAELGDVEAELVRIAY